MNCRHGSDKRADHVNFGDFSEVVQWEPFLRPIARQSLYVLAWSHGADESSKAPQASSIGFSGTLGAFISQAAKSARAQGQSTFNLDLDKIPEEVERKTTKSWAREKEKFLLKVVEVEARARVEGGDPLPLSGLTTRCFIVGGSKRGVVGVGTVGSIPRSQGRVILNPYLLCVCHGMYLIWTRNGEWAAWFML